MPMYCDIVTLLVSICHDCIFLILSSTSASAKGC